MKIKITIAVFASLILCGCINQNVVVQTTKSWENHYTSVESFKNGTKDISLQEGETIWVMSNETLKRVLKEVSRQR